MMTKEGSTKFFTFMTCGVCRASCIVRLNLHLKNYFYPVHLSVCPSVRLSVLLLSVDMILYTYYHHLCTWNFHIDLIIFLHFTGFFFLFLDLVVTWIKILSGKLWRILSQTLKMCCTWTETLYFLFWFSIFKELC